MKTNYSITSLKRWSCKSKEIPGIPQVKSIHVYDFDNTLFSSPLPSQQIWAGQTIGFLQTYEAMAYGGWWHDSSILMATGQGIEKEEPRAWEGSWNETVVDLVRCSVETKDALTVLLTGRGETNYADLINRILTSKELDFDLVALKPEVGPSGVYFESTMAFKQAFLQDLVLTYKHAEEIRIYEDRPRHVKGFRDYFEKLNKSFLSHPADQPAPPRKPITAEVIHVCELKSSLEPQAEIEAVQKAIARHNQSVLNGGPNPHKAVNKPLKIVENYLYLGHLINQNDSARLISLCNVPSHLIDSGEVRFMASNILIAPSYARKDVVQKAGGRGKKVMWQVNGVAKYEDRIWAARVTPISEAQVYTKDPTPTVVLAIRKGSRPIDASKITNWQPVSAEKAFMFQTEIGDKVMLEIQQDEGHPQAQARGRGRDNQNKRKFNDDTDVKENWPKPGEPNNRPGDRHGQGRYFNRSKANFNNANNPNAAGNPGKQLQGNNFAKGNNQQGRNHGGNARGGGKNRGSGNRGPAYKSLDDYGPNNFDGPSDPKGQAPGAMVMDY
ncbi:uncharacterized protein HMPREF1541_03161 [Cyphellophora europaea CBS 101466]|uniref:Swiss Army Knife RNA repair protein HAD domain-containing protein n=1 Tax=Cyphellophora europaea (strain CBS 101466) TaxID=1220924 RepID=W2RXH3_CYPE1|nr:uncharacterized protein HMPREF1541_03161 [Cyphellophora europaea CBS 101466]ETN41226.1 hypothetical protein HMPREF1541_03161 [Cyphellophora europaea CBS 101466]